MWMRWVKRLLACVAVLLTGAIVLAAVSWHLVRHAPSWYEPTAFDAESAERAEQKFLETLSSVQDANIAEAEERDRRALMEEAANSAEHSPNPITIGVSFTASEVNSFFMKWADFYDWEERYGEDLAEPRIVLRNGRLILAGNYIDLDTVVSLHFEPQLVDDGQLYMKLVRVMAGRLPLPPAMWQRAREKLTESLVKRLPELQRNARIADDGSSNEEAVGAAMSKLLLAIINNQPGEPIVFMPVPKKDRGVPVKLTDLDVKPDEIFITIQPLNRYEREQLLHRIRQPYHALAIMPID